MNVAEEAITNLGPLLKEQLEAEIVSIIAARLHLPPSQAMDVYYRSPLAWKIEEGEFGMQYLDASYLADEVLKVRP
ncbi:hypothetical protein GMI69_05245 [Eggerthellaceae bacterium zg-887]|uniref:hypothetical protein n=1 Tax=Xiamenia xianingshaonis TaxID=2682776 RepID=UPI00140D50A0|nr:hypothetical protein [Xiamenia xianingshaonis]NHM16068.1 hypothetical protein [Xiamenia xianingshaonis]